MTGEPCKTEIDKVQTVQVCREQWCHHLSPIYVAARSFPKPVPPRTALLPPIESSVIYKIQLDRHLYSSWLRRCDLCQIIQIQWILQTMSGIASKRLRKEAAELQKNLELGIR